MAERKMQSVLAVLQEEISPEEWVEPEGELPSERGYKYTEVGEMPDCLKGLYTKMIRQVDVLSAIKAGECPNQCEEKNKVCQRCQYAQLLLNALRQVLFAELRIKMGLVMADGIHIASGWKIFRCDKIDVPQQRTPLVITLIGKKRPYGDDGDAEDRFPLYPFFKTPGGEN